MANVIAVLGCEISDVHDGLVRDDCTGVLTQL